MGATDAQTKEHIKLLCTLKCVMVNNQLAVNL